MVCQNAYAHNSKHTNARRAGRAVKASIARSTHERGARATQRRTRVTNTRGCSVATGALIRAGTACRRVGSTVGTGSASYFGADNVSHHTTSSGTREGANRAAYASRRGCRQSPRRSSRRCNCTCRTQVHCCCWAGTTYTMRMCHCYTCWRNTLQAATIKHWSERGCQCIASRKGVRGIRVHVVLLEPPNE
jgi:hypothetical protein